MTLPISTARPDVEQPSTTLPFVSVIMPVRNEGTFIARSLGAVLAQDYPAERMEVLVADGFSVDETCKTIRQFQAHHANLFLIANPGLIVATGLNTALRQARGDVIVRVDGHCEIAPDYISKCVSHLNDDHVEAVGGPVETIGQSYVARAIAKAMSSWFGVGGSAFRLPKSETKFTDTVAFPTYTRAVMNRAGDFDEELVRNQDDEYNYRLRKLGTKILLAADVHSRYYSRTNLTRLAKQYFQYGYWKVRVMQKHPRQMRLRQFVPPLFVAALIGVAILMAAFPLAGYLMELIAGLYLIAAVSAAVFAARDGDLQVLPLVPVALAVLHVSYGLGFITGLVKFWDRWGAARQNSQPQAAIRDNQA